MRNPPSPRYNCVPSCDDRNKRPLSQAKKYGSSQCRSSFWPAGVVHVPTLTRSILPKPMMPVCGKPILARVMEIFASQGHLDFIISVGYRKEIILDYFATPRSNWRVNIVDTGEDTDTGGRIRKCAHLLKDRFFATYSDGLCDVDLARLVQFHHQHDGMATVTSVPLVSQYGTIESDGDGRVPAFREKPVLRNYWINAGFFRDGPRAFSIIGGAKNLERDVCPFFHAMGGCSAIATTASSSRSIPTRTNKSWRRSSRRRTPWLLPVAV